MLPTEESSWDSFNRRNEKPIHIELDHMSRNFYVVVDGERIAHIPHALWIRFVEATKGMDNKQRLILEEIMEDWIAVAIIGVS